MKVFQKNKLLWLFFGFAGASLIVGSCANIGFPSGGPKDTTPPVVLYSEPPNSSANFSDDQIRIFFDEFIQLRGLSQKLFISPPLELNPEIRVRGRSLVINLREKLRENTTYSFFFGDAIVDFTEGNAIPSFTFVVATGPYVDSLSLSGNVVEAFTMKPAEGVLVMLYDNVADSVPYLEFPSYVALTDKSGNYTINNIREGEFKIFALRDKNSNYKFDLPDEAVGFLDSLVVPSYAGSPAMTTTVGENKIPEKGKEAGQQEGKEQLLKPESLAEIVVPELEKSPTAKYNLVLFVEADTVQRITAAPISAGVVSFQFKLPFDSLSVRDLSGKLPEKWKYIEKSKNRDTLNLYVIPPVPDSLYLEIADKGLVVDTTKVATRPRLSRTRDPSRTTEEKVQLKFNFDRSKNLHYFESFRISAGTLIGGFDNTLFEMLSLEDSLSMEISFEIDSLIPRHLLLKTPLEAGGKYQLDLFAGAITDIFGNTNDSISTSFSISQPEDYSSLMVNLEVEEPEGLYVLQLLGKDNKTLAEKSISGAGAYSFSNLMPGNYGLRLIDDKNSNQKWDTGNYLKKIQPEEIYLYTEQIQIRQNWEAEISWVVKK